MIDEMEMLLEAARRANWDALKGPPHLRSGRFWIKTMTDGSELLRKPANEAVEKPVEPTTTPKSDEA